MDNLDVRLLSKVNAAEKFGVDFFLLRRSFGSEKNGKIFKKTMHRMGAIVQK